MEDQSNAGRGGGRSALIVMGLMVAGGAAGFVIGSSESQPTEREITVYARQYAYDPPVIKVNRGDTLRLRFVSRDVVHGFYLEGHDVDVTIFPMKTKVELRHPSRPDEVELVEEVVVKVETEGKYRFRCSHTCGYLHPFMLGEMIVGPNRLLPTSVGSVVGLLLGFPLLVSRRKVRSP